MRCGSTDGGRMRLCTPGSSMTPSKEERGHKGNAGCPGGFDSALWVNLSASVQAGQADGTEIQH